MGFLQSLFGGGRGGKRAGKVNIRNRFEVLREAISGTMSSFYMARDRESGQVVGLKVLDKEKTAAFEARFSAVKKQKEGEIAMLFHHPNIVKTLEHGVTTDNEQYIVMEFLDGPGLNSLIVARNPLLNGKRVALLRQAAESLLVVHKLGYIHRDVCPRNFVTDKQCQSLKLIDFGLTVKSEPPFTNPGNRTGTANYMAPEVVRRKATSTALDVFSYGVTAYELCAAALPWAKGTGVEAMSHGVEEPTDIREYRPKINQRLADAITACLTPAPEKRPPFDAVLKMLAGIEHEDSA